PCPVFGREPVDNERADPQIDRRLDSPPQRPRPFAVPLRDGKPSRHCPAPVSVEDDRDAADRLESLRRLLLFAADAREEFHSVSRAERGEKPAPRKASLAMPLERSRDSLARPLNERSIFRGSDFEDFFLFPLQEVVD